ncbi:FAD-binding and (Fe-S)-binding domain-containing protein [Lacisediminimonas sp.]|uniref:FAD-binding and (Fe-S)-binding domain-containing protein n=1 Tax=Lacisediminimonas sp. TaxID=3060582 RepID=UPI002718A008|nr:FAD-binding and (Fe-S)-binding domain-containing protein [Lacisediminimonas sp.]MDO8298847.1 FAD-linked oxidase C-terminal domain-containing protein [Lacisediminimonas sp.]
MGTMHPPTVFDQPLTLDAQRLATDLAKAIEGEVRFDGGSRSLYATDASNYRQVPIGVVIPRTIDDIVKTLEICRRHQAPVLARGGGTSLCGQTCNVAVVIDTSKYLNRVLSVDPERRLARVEPGVVCDVLRHAAEQHKLTFGPDPATHSRCTLGGMIGNNSCGAHSVMAGKTVDNIERLEILTYDGLRMWVGPTSEEELQQIIAEGGRRGEIYAGLKALRDRYADLVREKFPDIRRRVSGYNLDELLPENGFNVARALVGTEGTCAMILQAETRLVDSPPVRVLAVLSYEDIYLAADQTPDILPFGNICLEGLDNSMINDMRRKNVQMGDIDYLPEGNAWLLVEFGGDTLAEAEAKARALMQAQAPHTVAQAIYLDRAVQNRVWAIREAGSSARNAVPGQPETYAGWEDAAVDPKRLGNYLRDYRKLLDKFGYDASLYGHFGDGCIHGRVTFDVSTADKVSHWRAFLFEAAHLVVDYGGSLSGEHGDGQARAELLPIMFGDEMMDAFRQFKRIWDPANLMNPGKVIDAYPLHANLRIGPEYRPVELKPLNFSFRNDAGSFLKAAQRCVGAGKCRRVEGGAMCPSYRASGEERDSTRGRSRLLFEMLNNDSPMAHDWRNEDVKEALDTCLSCKSCKGECPVSVDMATYKAEFLSHYYEGRQRPRQHFLVGRINQWARLGALMPALTNFFTQTPGISTLVKKVAGVAVQRQLPVFASQTFRSWFKRRPASAGAARGATRVLLWPDTFNNHFHPEVARAAVEVLEHAGYTVTIPRQHLCCGRPLYDFGMLDQARAQFVEIMSALREEILAGVPLIGLEPSCLAAFRDELLNLFPNDELAQKLSAQSFMLSEFLDQQGYQPPAMTGKVLMHHHCHHKAVIGADAEAALLKKAGMQVEVLDSGCCGMAGSFGFDPEHIDASMRIGEKVLLPAVRRAAASTQVVTNGFSCREQVHQGAQRQTRHLAEVLRDGLGK